MSDERPMTWDELRIALIEAKAALTAARQEIELLKQMLDNAERHGKEAHHRAENAEAEVANILENLLIASDQELKSLVAQLADKMQAASAKENKC